MKHTPHTLYKWYAVGPLWRLSPVGPLHQSLISGMISPVCPPDWGSESEWRTEKEGHMYRHLWWCQTTNMLVLHHLTPFITNSIYRSLSFNTKTTSCPSKFQVSHQYFFLFFICFVCFKCLFVCFGLCFVSVMFFCLVFFKCLFFCFISFLCVCVCFD